MGRPLVLGQATAQRKQSMINDNIVDIGSAWSSDKVSGIVQGRNVLHNWDFRDPVNQWGLNEYDSGGTHLYTVDRWLVAPGATVMLFPGKGIRIERTGSQSRWSQFIQRLERGFLLAGKTVTVSAEIRTRDFEGFVSHTAKFPSDFGPAFDFTVGIPFPGTDGYRFNFIKMAGASSLVNFRIFPNGDLPFGTFIEVGRVKLELGTVSTLLNDPPMDFGRELAVCQRYQFVFNNAFVVRASAWSGNVFWFDIPVPTTMRVNPTINATPNIERNAGTVETGFAVSAPAAHPHRISFSATRTGHGMTDAFMRILAGTVLDANL